MKLIRPLHSAPLAATVEYAHQALRRLAAAFGASTGTMTSLAAVELGHGADSRLLESAESAWLAAQNRP